MQNDVRAESLEILEGCFHIQLLRGKVSVCSL